MPRLPHLHLHRIVVDDTPLPLVVNGRSQAAVRDHFLERHVRIERLSPEEAFWAGMSGAVIETVGEHVDAPSGKAERTDSEPGLFDQTHGPGASADPAVAASRPNRGPGPGYTAAVNEAATL
jgi:hypothetical protein